MNIILVFTRKSRYLDMEKRQSMHSIVLRFIFFRWHYKCIHLKAVTLFDVLLIDLEAFEKNGSLSDPSGVSLSIWVLYVRVSAHGGVCGSESRDDCEHFVCLHILQFHLCMCECNNDFCICLSSYTPTPPSLLWCHVACRHLCVPLLQIVECSSSVSHCPPPACACL